MNIGIRDIYRRFVSGKLLLFTGIWILTGCSEGNVVEITPSDLEGEGMVQISIFLLEGFENDTVVLKLNDEEVFRKEEITYSPLLGFADDSFKADVKRGTVTLEIILEKRDILGIQILEVHKDVNIGISIENGEIQFTPLPNNVGFG